MSAICLPLGGVGLGVEPRVGSGEGIGVGLGDVVGAFVGISSLAWMHRGLLQLLTAPKLETDLIW